VGGGGGARGRGPPPPAPLGAAGTSEVCPCFPVFHKLDVRMHLAAEAVSLVGLLGALLSVWWAHRRISRVPLAPAAPPELGALLGRVLELEQETLAARARYADIDEWRDDLTIAVSEGVKNVQRAENRIRATVRRAREELGALGVESPGLEAEATELRLVDGGRGEAGGVPTVPTEMGGPPAAPPGFPGTWSPDHLAYLRGA